jgi:16S rRNA (uracil1498-N3)-methyltransferase
VHRFYAPGFVLGSEVELPRDEGHHLARVMRLKAGDAVLVFDGRGREALARVRSISGDRVIVAPFEEKAPRSESAVAITLAQAMLKSDKMDGVIRDAVMLGVAAIQPLNSRRTDVPARAARSKDRHNRWTRTAISSAKQAGRAVVPPVFPALDFNAFLVAERDVMCLMFVEPGAERRVDGTKVAALPALTDLQSLESRVPAKATAIIGPEGGWDSGEIEAAVASGVWLVTLGRRVLRADMAGAIALAVLQYVWKDF